ncbi:hypothetical protein NP493_456g00005 [Ridgeia piscesae]|uniref:Uncharacterized protein n=1 Tax=Ridgeia piscesae TaxID=27915 RepID=A0AAD9NTI8_RIDPI|nr:hypothetical protein NP493_456g00005 [Ridgeia piscesae]
MLLVSLRDQQRAASGMEGCNKTNFIKTGIPEVTCPGPCATIYQKLGDKQFLLTRNCVPSCKERWSDTGTTECCYSSLCNAAVSHFRSATSCVVVAVFGTLLALVLRR